MGASSSPRDDNEGDDAAVADNYCGVYHDDNDDDTADDIFDDDDVIMIGIGSDFHDQSLVGYNRSMIDHNRLHALSSQQHLLAF